MYRIGVDLGGTNTVAGIVDEDLNVIAKYNIETPQSTAYSDIIKGIYTASLEALKICGIGFESVSNIGVCSPGTVNLSTGNVEFAGNLGFHNVPLRSELSKLFKRDVRILNDGNAIALGEAAQGAGKGKDSIVCIALGTGIGGGYCKGGKAMTGVNFAGAEFGHMVIEIGGKECKCGRRGCFEAYCSATALKKQTIEKMLINKDSLMWEYSQNSIKNVTAKTAFDCAKKGDSAALEVTQTYIRYLSCGITNLINIFQPDVFCISGGVSNEGDYLLNPVKKIVEAEHFSRYAKVQTIITTSKLKDSAGIIGAAISEE